MEPFICPYFFFNAVCIVSDNLLIIESFGEMAYNISYLADSGNQHLTGVLLSSDQKRLTVNIEELKKQAETEIADFIAQKIAD